MKNITLIHALVVLLGVSMPLHADVPNIINYQGRVAVNGTNFTGTGQFKFAIVNGASSQGTLEKRVGWRTSAKERETKGFQAGWGSKKTAREVLENWGRLGRPTRTV